MRTQNLHFMIKYEKFPKNIHKYLFSWAIKKISLGLKKRVRISYGKRVIGVRDIEFFLYLE